MWVGIGKVYMGIIEVYMEHNRDVYMEHNSSVYGT